jgi:hypothetical protein
MHSVASLAVDAARALLDRLRREGVSADLRTRTEANGLEVSEVMVEDALYGRACDGDNL